MTEVPNRSNKMSTSLQTLQKWNFKKAAQPKYGSSCTRKRAGGNKNYVLTAYLKVPNNK